MAACGSTMTGTSSSNSSDALCSSSESSSFQPIKTQVAIPTAHVMPSMLDASPRLVSESSPSRTPLASSLPVSSGDARGLVSNHDSGTVRPSQVFHRSPLLYRTSMENGRDQPLLLTSVSSVQKPIKQSGEAMLNHSVYQDRQSTGPWSQLQMFSSDPTMTGVEKEPCVGMLETKRNTETSRICEKQVSSELSPAGLYSNPAVAHSQIWKQEACALHQHENCALSAWKQHLDRVRLQLEQMQLQNKATCYHPLVNNALLPSLDPAQWVNIVTANENLLREKEILIDRQRQHISQLEQKVRESEIQVHSAFLGAPTASYGDMYVLRMQELQRENVFLRAQFTEKTESLSREKMELEQKLAASEASVKQIQDAHREALQKHAAELKRQEERVKARDKHLEHLKKKCQKELEQNREKQQRIETLERYVADLPMLEDHRKQSQQLKESQQAAAALQETVAALEGELGEVRATCREKELQSEVQKHREMELLSTVRSLQDKLQRSKNSSVDDYVQEMEREKREKDSLQKERDLLRKIVDNQKKRADQLSSQVKELEEQIAQEEDTAQALKADALKQESGLQQLHAAVKELSAQNQDLMERNLTLQEHLRQVELSQPLSDETARLTHELHGELASCLRDLQSVYSVVTQRAQGKDPNLSLLLGIHTVHCSVKENEEGPEPAVLAKKLEDVKHLRHEIEDLRTAISDRYAQDMGENCITQ